MRCAIYGAGAMGTVLGAFIARAGKQIDLVNRNERHIAALRKDIETFDDTSFPVCTGTDTRYLASTNREIVCIPHELPSPLVPDDDFLDAAQDMADEYGFLYLRLDSREAADVVLESALSLPAPLALSSDSAAAPYFRRRFCGKAPLI